MYFFKIMFTSTENGLDSFAEKLLVGNIWGEEFILICKRTNEAFSTRLRFSLQSIFALRLRALGRISLLPPVLQQAQLPGHSRSRFLGFCARGWRGKRFVWSFIWLGVASLLWAHKVRVRGYSGKTHHLRGLAEWARRGGVVNETLLLPRSECAQRGIWDSMYLKVNMWISRRRICFATPSECCSRAASSEDPYPV